MPKLPTNLARIGAVYKFRARVPNDLLDHYAPKKEIIESLKTKDLAEARRRLVNVQQRYHNEWERLRQNQFESQLLDAPDPISRPAGVGAQTVLPLNQEAIEFACTFLENSSLSGDEQTRLANNYTLEEIEEYRERLPPAIKQLRDMISVGDTKPILPAALQILQLKNIQVTGNDEDYRRLALAYARAALRTNEALLAQMNGVEVKCPEIKIPSTLGKPKVPLYSLFEYWRDAVAGRPQRTIDDVERRIKALDVLSSKKSAELLTREDIIAYRDQLVSEGKAPRTVKKDLSFVKAVLQHAYESRKIPANPAEKIKVVTPKGARGLKRQLEIDDLKVLFNSPIYAKNERPKAGAGDAAAWVPLIGLYAGARLEEICQLTIRDIRCSEGIHYFSIQLCDDEASEYGVDKTLKNDESRRSVPIHKKLIDAGFLKYVEHTKAAGKTWLFPDITPDQYDKRGGNFTKWWSRWRRSLAVGGAHRCFHAFRHTFKTACRAARIEEELHDAITGHSGGGVGRSYGSFPLEALNVALQQIEYKGLVCKWHWATQAFSAPTPRKITRVIPPRILKSQKANT
jgi:integrase